MKYFICSIYSAIIFISLFSLETSLSAQEENVRLYMHLEFDEQFGYWIFQDEISIFDQEDYYNYFEVLYNNGNPEIIQYHSGNEIISLFEFTYDENGNEIRTQQYLSGRLVANFTMEYNEEGRLVSRSTFYDNEIRRIVGYGHNHIRSFSEDYSDSQLVSRNRYNEHGLLIQTETYYDDLPDGIWYYYDDEGKKILAEWYDLGEMTRYNLFEYGEIEGCQDNELIQAHYYDNEDNLLYYDIFIYDETCTQQRRDRFNPQNQLIEQYY